jgi:predicted Rossmann-fold nucleotide-binding protein
LGCSLGTTLATPTPISTSPCRRLVGFARNALVASAGDIIVALPGNYGTHSEICYGLFFGRPVIDLGRWGIRGMRKVTSLDETEKLLKRLVANVAHGKAPRSKGRF